MSIQVAEWLAPTSINLTERDSPVAGPGQLVVAVRHCGICGSDLHSYSHGFAVQPGQVLGHEFTGRVTQAVDVAGVAVGDRVVVRPLTPCGRCAQCQAGEPQLCEDGLAESIGYGRQGAFAEQVLVPRAVLGETVFLVPDEVSDRAAALVEPLAVGLRSVRLAGTDGSGTAVVMGCGTIGLAAIAFLRLAGHEQIVAVDPSPLRREHAARLGATTLLDPLEVNVARAVREITGVGPRRRGARATVAIDCAGAPTTLATAVECLGPGGVVVIAAVGNPKVEISPDWFVQREIVLRGSYAYRDEFPAVIEHLRSGAIDAEALLSHDLPLTRIAEAFTTQLDKDVSLKVLVSPEANVPA